MCSNRPETSAWLTPDKPHFPATGAPGFPPSPLIGNNLSRLHGIGQMPLASPACKSNRLLLNLRL
ncbi:MAG TPA: hypothetical protein DHU55_15895 [Blastocatellia bacterium]|nr:hypothetical protein [Blastocatellia bacterium]HAF22470.1 hypothetical protein [Blastocatellia bacterium]HCX31228.1 hypothetical protein [Blastocatellia bacterium]